MLCGNIVNDSNGWTVMAFHDILAGDARFFKTGDSIIHSYLFFRHCNKNGIETA